MFGIIPEFNEEYKNQEIINFIKVSNTRESYGESKSQFFQDFFEFIFNNQILFIKTKENNINIDNFIISIYDNNICPICAKNPIRYQKNGKYVNVMVDGILYGESFSAYYLREPALEYIDLDKFNINPELDSFTIDHLTIDQLKQIKILISEHFKKIENYKVFFKNLGNLNINDLENKLNELLLIEKFLNDELDNINKKGRIKEKYFENRLKQINEYAYRQEKDTIINIIKELKIKITNNKKVNEENKIDKSKEYIQ